MNTYEIADNVLKYLSSQYDYAGIENTKISQRKSGEDYKQPYFTSMQVSQALMPDQEEDLQIRLILPELAKDGYAVELITNETGKGTGMYHISLKGKMFLLTDGYTGQAKREIVENELRKQQMNLNKLELFIKPYTLWIAIIGLAISMALAINEMNK